MQRIGSGKWDGKSLDERHLVMGLERLAPERVAEIISAEMPPDRLNAMLRRLKERLG